ncbi:hypothetical protein X798_06245, partial [Onchocerca flexuosa]
MFRMRTILFLLLLTVHHSWTSSYHCGPTNNTFFKFISHLLTMPCEQLQINYCCFKHDHCYSNCTIEQL